MTDDIFYAAAWGVLALLALFLGGILLGTLWFLWAYVSDRLQTQRPLYKTKS